MDLPEVRVYRAILVICFVVVPIAGIGLGVRAVVYSSSGIESVHCRSGQTAACLQTDSGVVEKVLADSVVRVRHDDGRRSTDLTLDSEWNPQPGHRVLLEGWKGRVVAVYDPDREERHKTSDWPDAGFLAAGVGAIVICCALLGLGLHVFADERKRAREV